MSGKLIYSLTEENPDLQKQIGCMNVLFQLFDRQHFVSGRRANHKRLPPAGQDGNGVNETLQTAKDKNQKAVKEKQRNSCESSRTSFSSSSCSSTFSSLDCNKVTQLEITSHETPSNNFPIKQTKLPVPQPIDLRDVVKESINREARGLFVHTANKETGSHTLKHIDSPRPMPLPKSMKPKVSNLNESSRTLGKLRDAPRFSYDGRESKDKTTMKPKELPRLSLDSRSGSIRSQSLDIKSNHIMENENTKKIFNMQEELGNRPSGIVAKLMGLDPLPSVTLTSKPEPNQDLERCSRLSNHANDIYESHISKSPRNSQPGVISPRFKNADSVMKLNISSRIPIEHAPWKQSDGIRSSPKPASKQLESPKKAANSYPSVYGEIEKRLTELEFRKSGKDLRALKQILEAMQKTNEMIQTKQDQPTDSLHQTCNSPNFKNHDGDSKAANSRNLQSKSPVSSTVKLTCHLKNSESPIVIMKPATTLVRKSKNPTSIMISIEGLPCFHKLGTGVLADKNTFVDKQTYKDRMAKDGLRGTSNRFHCSTDKSGSPRIRTPLASNVTQQVTVKSPRSTGALSPRLQRKQLTVDKQSYPTNQSSNSNRLRRQSREPLIELNSQERKIRPSSPNSQQSDDQVSEISSNMRYLSNQGDANSIKSESNTSYVSEIDADISSTRQCEEMLNTFSEQDGQKNKNPVSRLSTNESTAELAIPEQPSPVSVLDAMFYKDDLPSPVKKITYSFEDDQTLNSEGPIWISSHLHHVSDSTGSNLSFDSDHTSLENIEYLVQKLEQLNSPRSQTYIDEITPFPESKNEDHNYISEILLASGLLSRDHRSSLRTFQLHPTGYLLDPDLFFILEQSHAKRLSNVHINRTYKSMPKENIRRKLVFDVVNEILVSKLVSTGSTEPWFSRKKANKIPNGQQLTKELCMEIDQLQTINSDSSLEDDGDIVEQILSEDLRKQTSNWADMGSDVSGLVLDIERLIFKDLVTEMVGWEARARFGRNGRQLFAK